MRAERRQIGMMALAQALLAHAVWALGPHEILVLANESSTSSVALAREYCELRQVPATNLVLLKLPPALSAAEKEIKPEDFSELIWKPAVQAVKKRGLEKHVLAWVYSVDFPVRVAADPPLSLTGLTFMRNHAPLSEEVRMGTYSSLLYAGPDDVWRRSYHAQSLDVQREWLGNDMPIPAMMLGVTGRFGNSLEEIRQCLRRGREADGTKPAGTIYFVTNSDIRSLCRLWEFAPAAAELKTAGIAVVITNALPRNASAVLGIMTGCAVLELGRGNRLLPGAIGDHLTSAGASFDQHGQTRITEWLRAGATASAGAVTEPFANWKKFPHARLFVHYAAGCTMLESYYQAIRCPLQILPVGEPLAVPWAPKAALTLSGLEKPVGGEEVVVKAEVRASADLIFSKYLFLLDGRMYGPLRSYSQISLDPRALDAGEHVLRCVAYSSGSVRSQVFGEKRFVVKHP